MSEVLVSVGMSLDGFIAPDQRADDPNGERWMSRWMQIHAWVTRQRFFRENLKRGEGGETGRDNTILEETYNRTGVSIMGKRMFDAGEEGWPEEAPFHTPVFVLTHEVRQAWERPGDTTFYFVNDGIEAALRRARKVAGGRDIRIAGGGDTIVQYLEAGLVDEVWIALAPVLLGAGIRLFEGLDSTQVPLEIQDVIDSPTVTHLRYRVQR